VPQRRGRSLAPLPRRWGRFAASGKAALVDRRPMSPSAFLFAMSLPCGYMSLPCRFHSAAALAATQGQVGKETAASRLRPLVPTRPCRNAGRRAGSRPGAEFTWLQVGRLRIVGSQPSGAGEAPQQLDTRLVPFRGAGGGRAVSIRMLPRPLGHHRKARRGARWGSRGGGKSHRH
jgi:hypothetical protein